MKKLKILIIVLLTILSNQSFSQTSDKDWNFLLVREDFVKPYMTAEYEASLMDLTLFLNENKVKTVNYLTQLQDDYTYSHVTVLKNLNEIEGGIKAFINKKTEYADFNLIWNDLNESIESFNYYVLKYEPQLSYVPDGKVWLEEAPYRRWNYYYFKPGTESEVELMLAAWQNLYTNSAAPHGFRVFKGIVGIEQPVILFTTWAESPLDYQLNLQDNIKALGEEGAALWMAMLDLVRKVKTVEGWYLPQYSYIPK